jgi:cytoskeletal protein CcmA (bactofilin family)
MSAERIALGILDLTSNMLYAAEPGEIDIGIPDDIEFDIPEDSLLESAIIRMGGKSDYYLAEGDTADENVTIRGGDARIDGVVDGDLAVLGGNIEVNGKIDGDLAVFGGNLYIMGTVTGDAVVFGGTVNNRGTIEGDLVVIGGSVALDSASVVLGDVETVGGAIERHEFSKVEGDVSQVEAEVINKIIPRLSGVFRFTRGIPGPSGLGVIFLLPAFLVIYVLYILAFLIFPRAVDTISDRIQEKVWPSVGLGFGLEVMYAPIIVLLAVSIVGIPLIPLFALGIVAALLLGIPSICLIVGDRIRHGMNWNIQSRVGIFTLGWCALHVIPFLGLMILMLTDFPLLWVLGLLIVYAAVTVALGGVLLTLFKMKKKRTIATADVRVVDEPKDES